MASLLVLSNPVFRGFVGYAGLSVGKLVVMSPITSYFRLTLSVFANEEDAKIAGVQPSTSQVVERSRRAHQNDLENIVPFALLGLLYVAIGPNPSSALLHFKIFTAARFLHSIVYLFKVPQPARLLCFGVGLSVNLSMAYQVIAACFL